MERPPERRTDPAVLSGQEAANRSVRTADCLRIASLGSRLVRGFGVAGPPKTEPPLHRKS
jgi:hypothetical protein